MSWRGGCSYTQKQRRDEAKCSDSDEVVKCIGDGGHDLSDNHGSVTLTQALEEMPAGARDQLGNTILWNVR